MSTLFDPRTSSWILIYGVVKKGKRDAYFCFIAPFENQIMLGFEYGIQLFDPELRLEGDGAQVRYLTVREKEDIDRLECIQIPNSAIAAVSEPQIFLLLLLFRIVIVWRHGTLQNYCTPHSTPLP